MGTVSRGRWGTFESREVTPRPCRPSDGGQVEPCGSGNSPKQLLGVDSVRKRGAVGRKTESKSFQWGWELV